MLGSRAQHIQPIPSAMNRNEIINRVRQKAGKFDRYLHKSCFLILIVTGALFTNGLQAQSLAPDHSGSVPHGIENCFPSPEPVLQQGVNSELAGQRSRPGKRAWNPLPGFDAVSLSRKLLDNDSLQPMDAREGFEAASTFMAVEDAGARPVFLFGEDTSQTNEPSSKQIADGNGLTPTGESYFWQLFFLNHTDSLIYMTHVVNSEVVEFMSIHVRDFPPHDLPPIPLSELKSIPADFISSKDALDTALANGLDEYLFFTEMDQLWLAMDYELGGFYFEYPSHLDSESPVFWDVRFDANAWNQEQNEHVWVESNFLINAETGSLLARIIFSSDDEVVHVDFMDIFSLTGTEMLDFNANASLTWAFGREGGMVSDFPTGKTREWWAFWFDADSETVYLFFTRYGVIRDRSFFPLNNLPDEARPPFDYLQALELIYGSVHALETSLDTGLREQLEESPREASYRIEYNIHKDRTLFPDIQGAGTNPFWHLEVNVEIHNEHFERIYHQVYDHFVDAVTGAYLGTGTGTSGGDESQMPSRVALHQNYPNPFNPVTRIQWDLDTESHVTLSVFDLLGRKVAQLADEVQQAGTHSVSLDASTLSSGVYIYRLEAGGTVLHRSMTVVK
jgi:hypothetical protein